MTSEKHMNIEFKLPELGENITSGDVVNVLVREGDVIAGNDGVIELETDKAVVEIPCPHAGKVAKVHVAKGQTVKVGQPVLTIEAEAEAPATPQPVAADPAAAEAASPAAKPAKPKAAAPSRPGHRAGRPRGATPGPRTGRRSRAGARHAARAGGSRVEDVRALPACPRPALPPGKASQPRPASPDCRRCPAAGVTPTAEPASRPCRQASWAKTPTVPSAASGCRRSAAPSPRRWSSRPAPFRTSPTSTTPT